MTTEFFHRHKAGLLLCLYSLISILCLANRIDPTVAGIKSVFWFLISPEVVYTGKFFNKLDSLRGRVFQLARAEGENHILREQNIQLAKKELERDSLEEENNRLRGLLGLKTRYYPEGVIAEVVARDVRDWFFSLVIDKGHENGLKPSSSVVGQADGRLALVGRVVDIQANTSKVLLITDPLSSVSVSIPETQDLGLLTGQNKPQVVVKYLPHQSQVKAGDRVVTVGLGGVFSPGVPVGRVMRVYETKDGFFKEAIVQPFLNFGSIQEVMVLYRSHLHKSKEVVLP